MPTSNARRAALDKLREKASLTYEQLTMALDEDGHDQDCVLRCVDVTCTQMHSCNICREDGEV